MLLRCRLERTAALVRGPFAHSRPPAPAAPNRRPIRSPNHTRTPAAAPRSGLAWKNSIDVGAGVIDEDYRGNVGVILFNHSDADFAVAAGDRVAQLVLEVILTPAVEVVEDLEDTARGAGGFGSTGVAAPAGGGGGGGDAEKKPRTA